MNVCHCGNHAFEPASYWHVVLVSAEDLHLLRGADSIASHPRLRPKCATAYWRDGQVYRNLHHLVMPNKPGHVIDHKDRNPLDNRRQNLRYASMGESARNRSYPKGYTGFRGVQIGRSLGTYEAFIVRDRKRHYLGKFGTAKEAALAYNDAARRLHGEFAVLNKVDDVVGGERVELPTSGV